MVLCNESHYRMHQEGAKLSKMKLISELEERIQRLKEEEVLAEMAAGKECFEK